jgi:hypothetical protein
MNHTGKNLIKHPFLVYFRVSYRAPALGSNFFIVSFFLVMMTITAIEAVNYMATKLKKQIL